MRKKKVKSELEILLQMIDERLFQVTKFVDFDLYMRIKDFLEVLNQPERSKREDIRKDDAVL